jgi:uncharacterized membrane protein YeaQ/YmgE (transglycosylase-associated protein family)
MRWIVIIALGLVGAVWIGQGLGLIRGSSFMTDDFRWAAIGAVLVVVAVVLGIIERRRSRPGA